jgi:hypothetical protein
VAATRVGLRYAEAEGGLLSIIIPDDNAELDLIQLAPGQALHTIALAAYLNASPQGLQGILNAHTNKTAPHPRMAVVNEATGLVEGAVLAYPSTVTPPSGRILIGSLEAEPGDSFVDGVLVKAGSGGGGGK